MLTLIPVSLAQANEFVRQHHRHHKPVAGHKFSIGCAENGRLCAVAIVGRPVSRYLDDGFTLEVNRLCSDGTKNACSILYAAAARAARAMGYYKIITYTLDTESGASLRAAGWTNAGLAGGKAWTGSRRPTQPLYPAQMKYRYEKRLNERSCEPMAMSKIDRIDREIEKTRGKITEYQNRLKELEAQRTEQENFEIVNLVRSMCMSRDELMNFLRGGGNDAPPVETAYHEQEDMTDDEE